MEQENNKRRRDKNKSKSGGDSRIRKREIDTREWKDTIPLSSPLGVYSKGFSIDKVKGNNVEWWNNSPNFDTVTQVGFDFIYGTARYASMFSGTSGTAATIFDRNVASPGVLTVYFSPALGSTAATGSSSNADSAANRCFKVMYAALMAKTSGNNLNFQQADLALYSASMDSISMLISFVKRALGVSNTYSGYNYNYPDIIIRAMGINPSSVIGHQDDVAAALNSQIKRFNTMMLPRFIRVYDRHYSMCKDIYADEDDQRAQLYIFVPTGYYIYSDTDSKCTYTSTNLDNGSYQDINTVIGWIADCIDAWYESSDLGYINGALQRAFSDRAIIQTDYVDKDMAIKPFVDRNTLLQIMNSQSVIHISNADITQDAAKNNVIYNPTVSQIRTNIPALLNKKVFRMDTYAVSKEDVMEASRLMVTGNQGNGSFTISDTTQQNISCGTEFVKGYAMYYYTFTASGTRNVLRVPFYNVWDINATTWSTNGAIAALTRFKYAPVVIPTYVDTTTGAATPGEPIMSLMNVTTISADQITRLHESALQSAYEVIPVLNAEVNMKR